MKKLFLIPLFGAMLLLSNPQNASVVQAEEPISQEVSSIEEEQITTSSSSIEEEVSSSVEEKEEEEISSSIEEEVTCTVVISEMTYGDVMVDKESGEVGEVVTIYAKPYSLCKLETISVNGVNLTANEDGNYQFVLVEGENVITAEFGIDSESLDFIKGVLEDAKEGKFEDIFSMENLFNLLSWVVSLLTSGGFLVTLLKNKKIKSQTAKEIAEAVDKAINGNSAEAINKFLTETLSPIFDKVNLKMEDINDVCKTLARCFILSQENTPESRLAIINELTKLQKTSEELSEQVKSMINLEISKNEEIKNQKKKAIEDLETMNNALTETSEEDLEGRY